MSWTYTNDPANIDRDAVRLLIGDLDENDPQLTDQEIAFYLARDGNVDAAAVSAAKGLLALYSRLVDKAVGDLKISYSQRRDSYRQLIADLEKKLAEEQGRPYAGAITRADKDANAQDTSLVRPSFRRDQFRFPGTKDQTADPDDLDPATS